MPVYCYIDEETGEIVELMMSVAEMERKQGPDGRITLPGGRTGKRSISSEHRQHRDTPGNWPMWSDALGVNPDQIGEAVANDRKHGLNSEYHPETGCVKLESPTHRRRVARALGFHDRNAGYSDPHPD